jgi:hypothetical protein
MAMGRRLRDGMHEAKESLGSSYWGTRTSTMSLDDDDVYMMMMMMMMIIIIIIIII